MKTINPLPRFHIRAKSNTLFSFNLMPIGVPKVPFRSPGEEDAVWVDV